MIADSSLPVGMFRRPRSTPRRRIAPQCSRPRPGTFPRQCSMRCRNSMHWGSTSHHSGTAGFPGSRRFHTPGLPDSSHLAGSLRHWCSRCRRIHRRWCNNHRWCRHPRCCSTDRGRLAPPDSRWSPHTPVRLNNTCSRRPHCLGNTCRRCTSHRRSNNRCHSQALRDSTPRHGIRRHRHSTCCRMPASRGSNLALCSALRRDSIHPRTDARVGNTRCRRSDLPRGNT